MAATSGLFHFSPIPVPNYWERNPASRGLAISRRQSLRAPANSSAQNWRKPHKIPLSENHLAPAEDLRGLPATNLMLSAQLIIVDTRRGFDWRSSRRLQRGLFRGWKRTNARAA
jgi:hypothetical protein